MNAPQHPPTIEAEALEAQALETPALEAPAPLTKRQVLTVFAGLMIGMLLSALDQTIVSTALPTIVGELGGLTHLSWVVTAYMLASTVSAPIYGKLSDLYGRRLLFQAAIVIFLIGSVLAGLSQSMLQLIIFRGVQGAGGGGLMVLSMAIIADIVSPRERGRYQGLIGSVFGVASIAGPLLGGFFVDHLDWRWVFYVNLPLGAVALWVTQRALKLPHVRRERRIDWAGAALLTISITTLLLVTVWGGEVYPWLSWPVLTLAAVSLASLVAFIFVETAALEPILPLSLFRESVFTVGALLNFVLGSAMFIAVLFMPMFLQVVIGVSATDSGLLVMPLMAGMLTGSISSGRLITRFGRYKIFPVVGTVLVAIGYALLATMDTDTSLWASSIYMAIVGLGLGNVNPVVVLAIQNAVRTEHLGTATSTAQLFRSIGGTLGVSVFGALMNWKLDGALAKAMPEGVSLPAEPSALLQAPAAILQLPEAVQAAIKVGLAESITGVFLLAVPLGVLGFVAALLLKELPLAKVPRGASHTAE